MDGLDPDRLPRYVAWRDRLIGSPDERGYLYSHLSATSAVLFSDVMAPRFVEVRGCVLIAANYDAEYFETWWTTLEGDVPRIESIINHQHLWDLFESVDEVEPEALEHLARVMALTWKAAADEQFPDARMTVRVDDDYGPTLAAWSNRDAS